MALQGKGPPFNEDNGEFGRMPANAEPPGMLPMRRFNRSSIGSTGGGAELRPTSGDRAEEALQREQPISIASRPTHIAAEEQRQPRIC
jgi:hypothetical protein